MTEFLEDDLVLISPRHLAGAGLDRLPDAIGPLVHLFGWLTGHDPARGHVALDSPDHSLTVDFEPTRADGTWWTIANHQPYWEARFTRQTPIETIAAVTQVLPQLLSDHRHNDRIPLTTSTLADIAQLNGWAASPHGDAFTSPDGQCALRHTADSEVAWRAAHGLYEGFDTHWNATFTQDTPEVLVAQFFAHLASTLPVERKYGDIPYLVRDLGDALITPVRGAAVNPHVHHAAAQAGRVHHAHRR